MMSVDGNDETNVNGTITGFVNVGGIEIVVGSVVVNGIYGTAVPIIVVETIDGTTVNETITTDGCDGIVTIKVLGSDVTTLAGTKTGVDQTVGTVTVLGTSVIVEIIGVVWMNGGIAVLRAGVNVDVATVIYLIYGGSSESGILTLVDGTVVGCDQASVGDGLYGGGVAICPSTKTPRTQVQFCGK
jgi:hypothetical protein